MKTNEIISDALGVKFEPEILTPVKVEENPVTISETQQDQQEDYILTRKTFRNLIKKCEDAISTPLPPDPPALTSIGNGGV
mgnify:CR=1 FL=1